MNAIAGTATSGISNGLEIGATNTATAMANPAAAAATAYVAASITMEDSPGLGITTFPGQQDAGLGITLDNPGNPDASLGHLLDNPLLAALGTILTNPAVLQLGHILEMGGVDLSGGKSGWEARSLRSCELFATTSCSGKCNLSECCRSTSIAESGANCGGIEAAFLAADVLWNLGRKCYC